MLADLRKLIDGHQDYPPSEALWKQLVNLIEAKNTKENRYQQLKDRLRRETEHCSVSLPEPVIARFHHQGQYYYLDPKGNIYQLDDENPIVGNLVGHVLDGADVIIHNQSVFKIPEISISAKELYQREYYLDANKGVYKAFHPNHPFIYQVGTLTPSGKIKALNE